MINFTFNHGMAWFSWVVIIFAISFIVLLFITFPHLVTVLGAFGFDISPIAQDALFWLLLSVLFLSALRGAKVEIKIHNDK